MPEPNKDESSNGQICNAINRIFSDDLMIVMAAIPAVVFILQLIFDFSLGMLVVFDYLNYFIIYS